ncbi:hypothetical protein SKAU_G00387200 [Synaphobranchus kaupii]|uniref:Uncharacterized protein n=1 Tax=Synaphobranchus kaupii TaxID=118154 RepID=A0A9Q1EAQ8_SYNKA|nr:hypothetical protein SKAU_G00387200 [Synaphobranchus kaupii]
MLLLWTVLDPLLLHLHLHLLLTPARLTSRRPCSRSPRGAKTRPSEPEPESEDGWHDMVDEDEEPHQFPFCPRRTPEVQLDLQQDYSPLDLFRLFFSTDVLKLLCDNTNGNAARKHALGLHTSCTWVLPLVHVIGGGLPSQEVITAIRPRVWLQCLSAGELGAVPGGSDLSLELPPSAELALTASISDCLTPDLLRTNRSY